MLLHKLHFPFSHIDWLPVRNDSEIRCMRNVSLWLYSVYQGLAPTFVLSLFPRIYLSDVIVPHQCCLGNACQFYLLSLSHDDLGTAQLTAMLDIWIHAICCPGHEAHPAPQGQKNLSKLPALGPNHQSGLYSAASGPQSSLDV